MLKSDYLQIFYDIFYAIFRFRKIHYINRQKKDSLLSFKNKNHQLVSD